MIKTTDLINHITEDEILDELKLALNGFQEYSDLVDQKLGQVFHRLTKLPRSYNMFLNEVGYETTKQFFEDNKKHI